MSQDRPSSHGILVDHPQRPAGSVPQYFPMRAARNLTRLDILDSFSEIMVCVAYELEGQRIDYFPGNAAVLDKCRPIYETLEGWRTATSHLTSYDELPKGLKNYIARLEELIGCPVHLACIGPERSQAIIKEPIF